MGANTNLSAESALPTRPITHSFTRSFGPLESYSETSRSSRPRSFFPPRLLPSLSSQMIIGATRRKDRANFLGGVSATTVAMYGYDGVSRSEAPSPNATPPLKISGVSVPRVFLVPPCLDPQRTENEGIAPIYRVSPLFLPHSVSGEISPLVVRGN